ncbi:MAG: hypothetical protein R3349_01815 [Geminicoccaceae bacterium]|nr:hypothetical protein [Geminicoccaceae bacterium]
MNEVTDARWVDGRARFHPVFDRLVRARGPRSPSFPPNGGPLHPAPEPSSDSPPSVEGLFCHLLRVLLVPGFAASLVGSLGEPLLDAACHVRTLGVAVETIPVHGLASSRRNARLIERAIAGARRPPDERMVLLGYSKGAMDALVAVTEHPGVADRVAALVSLTGSIGGSLLVDDLPEPLVGGLHRIRRWLPTGGLWSLRRRQRRAWLQTCRPPARVRLYSVAAHAGRERISGLLRPSYERLRWTDRRNDGQVLLGDQIVPGSTLLAELNCDHWAAALPLTRSRPWLRHLGLNQNDFPRPTLLEAILRVIDHDLMTEQSAERA